MYGGCEGNKNVPNRMGKGYATVRLEEEHSNKIEYTTFLQVGHGWDVVLEKTIKIFEKKKLQFSNCGLDYYIYLY